MTRFSFCHGLVLANCVLQALVLLLYGFLAIDAFVHQSRAKDGDGDTGHVDKGKGRAAPLDSPRLLGTDRGMKTASSDCTLTSSSTGRTLVAPVSPTAPSSSACSRTTYLPFPLEVCSPSADELARFGEAASPGLSDHRPRGQHPRTRKVALRAMRPSSMTRSNASRSVPIASRRGITSIQAEERLAALHDKHAHIENGSSARSKGSPLLPTWLPPTDSTAYAANIDDDNESSSDGSATECFPFEDPGSAKCRKPSRFYALHANTSIGDLQAELSDTGKKPFQPIMPPLRNSRRHAAFSKQIARDFGTRLMTLQPVPASPSPHASEDTDSSPGSPRKQSHIGTTT